MHKYAARDCQHNLFKIFVRTIGYIVVQEALSIYCHHKTHGITSNGFHQIPSHAS